jgi:hypothetical protein
MFIVSNCRRQFVQPPFSHGRLLALAELDRIPKTTRAGTKETDMNRIFKTAILSAAIAATTLATLPAANADDWYHRHHHGHGGALAAGVLGLATGALIVGALNQPRDYGPGYDDYYGYARPAPVRRYYYAQPQVAYADPYARPWTRAWYEYCADRYRSFNARSGTFTGNDGEQHFCIAN